MAAEAQFAQQRSDPERHILLVEDDDDHAELILYSIADLKIRNQVVRVPDGEAAMAYLDSVERAGAEGAGVRPDLVLLDLRLPRMDGIEVLKRIRRHPALYDLIVVILTSSAADRDLEAAYRNHANSYLVKPVEYDAFCEMMDALGVYWMTWNQHPKCPTDHRG